MVVLHKSLWLQRPQGDLRVFCRAGWAIRQGGQQLYQITDDNGWHYHYPPPFAILMAPLADPPRREIALVATSAVGLGSTPANGGGLPVISAMEACSTRVGLSSGTLVPYSSSVLIFYIFNLACLFLALRLVASLLPDEVQSSWRGKVVPLVVCLPPIGLTLVRGQVQILLLLLLAGFVVGLIRGRRILAGLCLAGAISLKIFPAYLLLVPLVRRDKHCLAGCLLGLFLALVLLPVLVVGPEVTSQWYLDRFQFVTSVFSSTGSSRPGAAEMLEATACQSQSFQVVLHKTLYLGSDKVPPLPATWTRVVHWLLSGLLTIAILLPGRLRNEQGLALLRRVGLLMLVMVLICPVCHLHYLTLAVPLIASLAVRKSLAGRTMILVCFILATSLPMLPGLGIMRNVGVPLYGALVLGLLGWLSARREWWRPG